MLRRDNPGQSGYFQPPGCSSTTGAGRASADETSLYLRAAIQRRRRRVNTLLARCESDRPGTLSSTRLNGPVPLSVPRPGVFKPFTPERGPSIWPQRGEERRGVDQRESLLTHLNKRLMLVNNGGILLIHPPNKSRISTVQFRLKLSEATKDSFQVVRFNSSCSSLLSRIVLILSYTGRRLSQIT